MRAEERVMRAVELAQDVLARYVEPARVMPRRPSTTL
jgi:hypothetical protein